MFLREILSFFRRVEGILFALLVLPLSFLDLRLGDVGGESGGLVFAETGRLGSFVAQFLFASVIIMFS